MPCEQTLLKTETRIYKTRKLFPVILVLFYKLFFKIINSLEGIFLAY